MPRRAVTFVSAAVLVVVLALGGALLPVPYVALLPGPTKNVLGKVDGKPLISISGHETYEASGHLNLVTVAYQGGPGYQLDVITALRGWIDPEVAVVPREVLFPESQSAEEVRRTTSRKMRKSQQTATVAAVRELGLPVDATVTVAQVLDGYPAQGKLRTGDQLVAVDGEKVSGPTQVSKTVSAKRPGDPVTFTVMRDGEKTQVRVRTERSHANADKAMVGVYMQTDYQYPLDVNIRIHEIGGPSAGLMFALGIVDKLTEGDLTGGTYVAGTGTISPSGKVGPIGGIAQKMAGARSDGANVFLTPAGNCAEAVRSKPSGLRLVKTKTLHDARQSLQQLKNGGGGVPTC